MENFERRLGTLMRDAEVPPLQNNVAYAVHIGRHKVTRRRVLAGGLVAGVTAVALVGVAAALGEVQPQPPIPAVMPPVSELPPPEVRRPALRPPDLPEEGPVGRGFLIYNWGGFAETSVMVMSDGRQYQLPGYGTVSPDGAWYGYVTRGDDYLVRDLTGTRTWKVPGGLTGYLWSPDSRWLVLVHPEDRPAGMEQPGTKYAVVLDLRTGKTHRVQGIDPLHFIPVAMLPSGELVYGAGVGESAIEGDQVNVLELRRVDVVSGKQGTSLRVDLSRWLEYNERIRTTEGPMLKVSPDGRTAVVKVSGTDGMMWPVALLVMDFADGTVQRRIEFPNFAERVNWQLAQVRVDGTGIELRTPPLGEPDTSRRPSTLLLVELATGEHRTVTRLYDISAEGLIVRGQTSLLM
ncbi:MAG: hypothetical protein ACRDT4_17730 [Micromonosporaceae bacterium]